MARSFLKFASITPKPTSHSARAVDKSPIGLHGEVHITLNFDDMQLPINALVVDQLDCDILAGVPFCKDNNLEVHLRH